MAYEDKNFTIKSPTDPYWPKTWMYGTEEQAAQYCKELGDGYEYKEILGHVSMWDCQGSLETAIGLADGSLDEGMVRDLY